MEISSATIYPPIQLTPFSEIDSRQELLIDKIPTNEDTVDAYIQELAFGWHLLSPISHNVTRFPRAVVEVTTSLSPETLNLRPLSIIHLDLVRRDLNSSDYSDIMEEANNTAGQL